MINSIKSTLLDKLSSPLAGSFIPIWIIHNWKVVLTIFDSKLESEQKIKFIDNFYQTNHDKLITDPFFYTCLFIVIYAFLSIIAYTVWELPVPIKKIVSNFFGSTYLLTKTERDKIINERYEKETFLQNNIDRLESELEKEKKHSQWQIKSLENINEKNISDNSKTISDLKISLAKEINNKKQTIKNNQAEKTDITEEQIEILKYLTKQPNSSEKTEELRKFIKDSNPNFEHYQVEHIINSLFESNLFSEFHNAISISNEGMSYLVNHPLTLKNQAR